MKYHIIQSMEIYIYKTGKNRPNYIQSSSLWIKANQKDKLHLIVFKLKSSKVLHFFNFQWL